MVKKLQNECKYSIIVVVVCGFFILDLKSDMSVNKSFIVLQKLQTAKLLQF